MIFDEVMGGERLATWNRSRGSGGEWDRLRAVPLRERRRLAGAGLLSRSGVAPDVLAEMVRGRVHGVETTCEAVEWYLSACAEEMRSRAVARNAEKFRKRDSRARKAGFGSYWYLRLYRSAGLTERGSYEF